VPHVKKFRYPPLAYPEKVNALLAALWFMLICLVMYFMVSRYVMFSHFADPADLVGRDVDIRRMWLAGLRYDARVCAIMLLPPFILGVILCAGQTSWRLFLRLGRLMFALAALAAALFSIGNYYYYQTYHNFIDIFVFGFLGEDQAAVLGNIWDDYPVIRIGVALALLTGLPAWLAGRILRSPLADQRENLRRINSGYGRRSRWPGGNVGRLRFWLCLLLSGALFFLIARGGFDTFPLGRNAARVSSIGILNKLTPNGLITFHWARQDYDLEASFRQVSAGEGKELLRAAGLPALLERTPRNARLEAARPNVVLALMESFGANMLALDQPPQNDLLGALRPHFQSDFLFQRFLPEGNGTAPSLAALFFLSPVQNISHSVAQNSPLARTPFRVYREAGYRTVFIYPGNMMWRNLAGYLPLQGVDHFYDENELIALYPEAARDRAAWGVPDEYAYRLAQKLLAERGPGDKPVFIGILTTTNHPPYQVPSTYSPAPVELTEAAAARMLDDAGQNRLMLRTFQYSADALGRFLDWLKASRAGANTLVAATGDHQMRRMQVGAASEQALDTGVPFYLYVPKLVLDSAAWRFEAERPGSHKDILPTLYALSLSGAEYLALGGRNLLAERDDAARAFGYNERMWIDGRGAYVYGGKGLVYEWSGEGPLLVKPEGERVDDRARMDAYPQLLRWQINARVSGQDDLLGLAAE
jgi:phosphoglycerol transferase MdoB-like AlkP superfamily enzyme